MRKKIFFMLALSFTFAACDYNEKNFEGLDEMSEPKNEAKYTLEYDGEYPKDGYFSPVNKPAEVIPGWLWGKFFSANKGSTATVNYKYQNISVHQDFEKGSGEMLILNTKGENKWEAKSFSGNSYIQASAYKDAGGAEMESWAIFNSITVGEGAKLSFDACYGNYRAWEGGQYFYVLVSDDFNGADPSAATWTDITSSFNIPVPTAQYGTLENVGEHDMADFAGKDVTIAFKYVGNVATGKTTTVQIDNIFLGEEGDGTQTAEYTFEGYDKKWVFSRVVPNYLVSEDFENTAYAADKNVEIEGWGLYSFGDVERYWIFKTYSGNKYVQFSAYKTSGACEGWLILPKVTPEASGLGFTFDAQLRYFEGECLTVWASTDFDGTKDGVKKASWTDITSSFGDPVKVEGANFVNAGVHSLDEYIGKNVYFAFKYVGNGNDVTTTCQIDNVLVGKIK